MDSVKTQLMNPKTTRRQSPRKRLMEPNLQEELRLPTTNQRTVKQVDKSLRYHRPRANKVVLKIMMMERKKRKEINSQRNLKIDVIE
jgi:hypothetical protein